METEREKRQTMYEENQNPESVYDALIAEAVSVDAPPSYDELLANSKAFSDEVARLTNLNNYYQQLLLEERKSFRSKVADLETYLDENWDDLDSHAEEIGNIFGIEAEKTIDITVTIDYSITVTVPRNKVEEINEDNFDFDVSSNNSWLGIEDSSAWVRSVDF